MAKKSPGRSLMDFETENLLAPQEEEEKVVTKEEEDEDLEEQEEEEEKPKKVAKKEKEVKPKKEVKKVVAKQEEEEEESEEDDKPLEETVDKEEEPEPAGDFWEAVEKITGNPLDIEYGNVDPVSPQGVAIREKALAEKAVDDFLDNMQLKQPKVYKALEHAMAGGSIEDLFTPGEKDYAKVTIKEGDEDHAKMILREYYQKRGITNEGRIARMIATDADSEEGLVKSAEGALQEMKETQETDRVQKIEEQKIRDQRQKALDNKMIEELDGTINTLQLGSFRIPSRKEAEDFSKFVRSSVQRDGSGGYLLVVPLEQGNLEKQLQAEYFRFKKGDLEKLIMTKATTKNAESLKLKLSKEKEAPRSSTGLEKKDAVRSMKDYEVD